LSLITYFVDRIVLIVIVSRIATDTKDFASNIELIFLVRLQAGELRFSRCLSQRRVVKRNMLIFGNLAIVLTPAPFGLRSNASKNRVRVIVLDSCLLRVVRGVNSAIMWIFR